MDQSILIIEDDKGIVNLLSITLKTSGYKITSTQFGQTGLNLFRSNNPDLILLDLGLPDIDGLVILEEIRKESSVPILIISARYQEEEKVLALDNGADDYITKPFSTVELLARIRVAFRRQSTLDETSNFEFDQLVVDFEKRKVFVRNEETHLTPIEYKILCYMIENKGRVLTHRMIQEKVWGYSSTDDYKSLRVFMGNIRRKIEIETVNPRYILTEVGVGYRFADE
jgi:two-component system KDP operon response regulator KdpE